MRFGKVIAGILCGAFVLGTAGCAGGKKSRSQIENVLFDYEDALQRFDEDDVLDMTVWSKSDKEYEEIQECFVTDGNASYIWKVFDAMARTIEIEYDSDDIKIDKDSASVKVTYTLADWEYYFNTPYYDSDSLVKDIAKMKKKTTVSGKLEFVLEDGEWLISKITKLDEVLDFSDEWPYLDTKEWPTMPVFNDPEPVDSLPDDLYQEAIKEYLTFLEINEEKIRAVEDMFGIETCGLYDVDSSGIPEFFFIAEDVPSYSGAFQLYTYHGSGSSSYVEIPGIVYQAGTGGAYNIYSSGGSLILSYSNGEASLYTYYSRIFTFGDDGLWGSTEEYRHEVQYYYNEDLDDLDTLHTYYLNDQTITEESYNDIFGDYMDNTSAVIESNYDPPRGFAEYDLAYKYHYETMSYDEMHAWLEGLL